MVELMSISAARVRIAALDAGWRRDPVPIEKDGRLRLRWVRGDVNFMAPDPETMREPMRQAWRAYLIAFFALACPVCEQQAEWLTYPELRARDVDRMQVMTVHKADLSSGQAASIVLGIEHAGECPVRPAMVDRWAGAQFN